MYSDWGATSVGALINVFVLKFQSLQDSASPADVARVQFVAITNLSPSLDTRTIWRACVFMKLLNSSKIASRGRAERHERNGTILQTWPDLTRSSDLTHLADTSVWRVSKPMLWIHSIVTCPCHLLNRMAGTTRKGCPHFQQTATLYPLQRIRFFAWPCIQSKYFTKYHTNCRHVFHRPWPGFPYHSLCCTTLIIYIAHVFLMSTLKVWGVITISGKQVSIHSMYV